MGILIAGAGGVLLNQRAYQLARLSVTVPVRTPARPPTHPTVAFDGTDIEGQVPVGDEPAGLPRLPDLLLRRRR